MYFRYDDIKVGDMVEIRESIRTRYKIDNLVIGKRRIALIGQRLFVTNKRRTADGRTRYYFGGTNTIPWSRSMFDKIEREENEI